MSGPAHPVRGSCTGLVATSNRRRGGVRVGLVVAALLGGAPPVGAAPQVPPPREVVLKTSDGIELRAAFHPASTAGGAGVVLLPAFRSNRTAWDRVIAPLRDRGVHVLALDPRGHGRSARSGKVDLSTRVAARDPTLFAAMHADAIAAVRWLVQEGKCDAKRIAVAGAGVGGSVAIDMASRHPGEVAAVAWLSPGAKYLGIDAVQATAKLPVGVPLLALVHRHESELARPVLDARPGARVVVYDETPPAVAGAERAWAHGTRMFGTLPLVDRTIASFVAMATGSKVDDVVIDGLVTTEGPNADGWDRAVEVGVGAGDGTMRAYRVGRRLVFGGTAGVGVRGLCFEVMTGNPPEDEPDSPHIGPPQVVGYDLGKGEVAWSWGGLGSMPNLPGLPPAFGKTHPVLRVVRGEEGSTFEGEWFIPAFFGTSGQIRLVVSFSDEPPPAPSGGVESYVPFSVEIPAR